MGTFKRKDGTVVTLPDKRAEPRVESKAEPEPKAGSEHVKSETSGVLGLGWAAAALLGGLLLGKLVMDRIHAAPVEPPKPRVEVGS